MVGEMVGRRAIEFKLSNEYGIREMDKSLLARMTRELKETSHFLGRDLSEGEFRLIASKMLGKMVYGQNECIAVVLVKEKTNVRREEVWRYLRHIQGINDIYETFGSYDYVVQIEVDDEKQLDLVTDKIRRSNFIRDTETLVVISKWRWS